MNKKYELFVESLSKSLLERLGLDGKQIYFEKRDENGMTPNGDRLFIECRVSSVGKEVCGIHIEEMYEKFLDGIPLKQIADLIEGEIRKVKDSDIFEKTKNLNDFDKIKKDLFVRLLNRKLHEKELSKAVYQVVGDIALVLYMQVGNSNGRVISMKIRRENLKEWGLDAQTVFDTALLNTYFMSPPRIYSWKKILSNPNNEGEDFMDPNNFFQIEKGNIGSCLSTVRKTNGAVAIFIPGVAKRLADLLEGDFYLVFTSIHEVMIHSTDNSYPEDLERILKETIRESTPKEDFLTYKIYRYSRATGHFSLFYKNMMFLDLGVPKFPEEKGPSDK